MTSAPLYESSVRPCLGHGIGLNLCQCKTMSGTSALLYKSM
ncbi:hypothetical protein F383_12864 [Gossypium arboreum]|uniref:Uncharacterized protein n=1 Tax=Gossypium arboreum TaxID=29729 RepID=A0A0B0Q1R3_GOSAR|nr:hypothetical protein F383_12864 [Gossypium arboreum]